MLSHTNGADGWHHGVVIGRCEQLHQTRHEAVVNNVLYLVVGAVSEVRHAPAGIDDDVIVIAVQKMVPESGISKRCEHKYVH